MPIAISLRAEGRDAAPIRELWDRACVFEAAPSMRALVYSPHITLAVYEERVADGIRASAELLFAHVAAVELLFSSIRWFDGPPLVLYAAPEPSPPLDRLHTALHHLIASEQCRPHYRPGNFVPHCTLAMRVVPEHSANAMAFARRTQLSFRATFARGDVVSFPPVRVLSEWCLSADAAKS